MRCANAGCASAACATPRAFRPTLLFLSQTAIDSQGTLKLVDLKSLYLYPVRRTRARVPPRCLQRPCHDGSRRLISPPWCGLFSLSAGGYAVQKQCGMHEEQRM